MNKRKKLLCKRITIDDRRYRKEGFLVTPSRHDTLMLLTNNEYRMNTNKPFYRERGFSRYE